MSVKNRKFQFRLSTAILSMFVASGLLWANFRERLDFRVEAAVVDIEERLRGWPFDAYRSQYVAETYDIKTLQPISDAPLECMYSEWHINYVVYNSIIAITIVIIFVVLSEFYRSAKGQNARHNKL